MAVFTFTQNSNTCRGKSLTVAQKKRREQLLTIFQPVVSDISSRLEGKLSEIERLDHLHSRKVLLAVEKEFLYAPGRFNLLVAELLDLASPQYELQRKIFADIGIEYMSQFLSGMESVASIKTEFRRKGTFLPVGLDLIYNHYSRLVRGEFTFS